MPRFFIVCGITTGYWYYRLFLPWVQSEARAKQSEAKLLGQYVKKLEVGDIDAVIYSMKIDVELKNSQAEEVLKNK